MCLTIALDAACCAGKAFCDTACCCCKALFKTTLRQQVKLSYIILSAVATLFVIFVLYWIQDILSPFKRWIHCPEVTGGDFFCLGVGSVFRMSLALAIFFLAMLLLSMAKNQFAKQMNEGGWACKILCLVALFILFNFVSNTFFFDYYRVFSKYIGFIFLIFQMIMLIDLFWMWGENWVQKFDQGEEIWKYLLIGTAVLLYGVNITMIVLNFKWFGGSGCGANTVLNIVNIVMSLIMTGISVSGITEKGSLITAGAISLYLTYITYSGFVSGPTCNKFVNDDWVMAEELVIQGILIMVSLCYLALNTSEASSKRIPLGNNKDLSSGILDSQQDNDEEENDSLNESGDLDDAEQGRKQKKKKQKPNMEQLQVQPKERSASELRYQTNNFVYFHLIMLVGSVYMCMLVTNWGAPTYNQKANEAFSLNDTSKYLKLTSSYCACLLYVWTVVAPRVLSNRQF